MYKNSEGYVDPTAGVAMATVKREENAGVEIPCRQHPPRVGKGAFNRRRL